MDILPLFIRTALIYIVVLVIPIFSLALIQISTAQRSRNGRSFRTLPNSSPNRLIKHSPSVDCFQRVRFEGLPLPLIMNGKVQDENLEKLGKTRFWLKNVIQQKGVRKFKEVFFCSVDHNGRLFLDRNRR